MLEIRNCTKLPGQQGVYATADIAAGKLFVAYGRSLPVRFNARRHAQGKQVMINNTIAYDLTMSDRFLYKLNCAGYGLWGRFGANQSEPAQPPVVARTDSERITPMI